MNRVIKINAADNVAIALQDLSAGTVIELDGNSVELQEAIPQGHKFTLQPMAEGDNVIKYGYPIGHLIASVSAGQWINPTNLKTNLSDKDSYQYSPDFAEIAALGEDRTVNVYTRANGDVGIRNQLWIIPTVGCVNAIAQRIKKQAESKFDLSNIDGIEVYTHPYGCSQLGDDHLNTRTILQNMAHHPNAGAVLVIGLGCENNQISQFKETLGQYDENRVEFMVCQVHEDEVAVGLDLVEKLIGEMNTDQRTPAKLSQLKFGLECGGSDGFSGITANPLLGMFSDYVTQHGGTSVLTEVPEMFGAEHILMAKCKNETVFQKTADMVNDFKQYYIDHNQPIYENPSPGNKAGGISTLEEKSLGCTQKAGQSKVVDVLKYGERLVTPGLNLLSAPGNDAVATTALASAGCHMVLFSTGRGTPYGGPVPTVKIATNTTMAQRKSNWIDFNAGQLVDGKPMPQLLGEFIDCIVGIANGDSTKNELNEFSELAIFKSGVTL